MSQNDFYKNSIVSFEEDKITCDLLDMEVMMSWEDPIMSEHANIVCHNQGDVLEIGFGMGISADYIQSLNPNSHTIVEIHPQIFSKLETWAVGKPNVTIINGDWFGLTSFGEYDGIFYDTVCDSYMAEFFTDFVPSHIKVGGKFTYFNPATDHIFYGLTATHATMSVTPPNNGYFTQSVYYVPTVQF